MKIKYFWIIVAFATLSVNVYAQNNTGSTIRNRKNGSFAQFRESILKNYKDFRGRVLSDYQKYLDGIWEASNLNEGESRYTVPKPQIAPVFTEVMTSEDKPLSQHQIFSPSDTDDNNLAAPSDSKIENEAQISDIHDDEIITPLSNSNNRFHFNFYGMDIEVDRSDFDIRRTLVRTRDYAAQWRELNELRVAETILPVLLDKSTELGLNDYFTYQFFKSWANALFPDYDESSRMSLVHYLLVYAGYDARIAVAEDFTTILLLACEQIIYGRQFLFLNDTRYTLFANDDAYTGANCMGISTCQLPQNADLGRKFDMHISHLNIPYAPKPFTLQLNDTKITGEVNSNLAPMLYRYPQVSIDCYAESCVDMDVRAEVSRQFSEILSGQPQLDAINNLLHFVQNAFEYASDEQIHGFEKPYFFEEMLLYDKCDCEDRAIFYTYLLWNVLGVPCHLITYPGHESVAVNLSEELAGGIYYLHDGSTFFISDPTYIGSSTGQCMSEYRYTSPQIDYEYK